MKTDVYQKITADFGADYKYAIELLDELDAQTKGLISDRVLRAIIFLASGNTTKLKRTIELCRTDFRDVLWQAEYDCGEQQIYDFTKSFHDLNLICK
jgi:hypothetical protein